MTVNLSPVSPHGSWFTHGYLRFCAAVCTLCLLILIFSGILQKHVVMFSLWGMFLNAAGMTVLRMFLCLVSVAALINCVSGADQCESSDEGSCQQTSGADKCKPIA